MVKKKVKSKIVKAKKVARAKRQSKPMNKEVVVKPAIVVEKKPKTLVVYYSLEGNTKALAEEVAKELEAELLELKPLKDVSPKGVMKYIWGGRQAMTKALPELASFAKNPQDYEVIVIGTPVWAWTFSPAVRSFLKKAALNGKKVAYFATHEGGLGNTLEHFGHELKDNVFIHKADFKDVRKTLEESRKKAMDWAKEIKAKL
jgi:flavodoxin